MKPSWVVLVKATPQSDWCAYGPMYQRDAVELVRAGVGTGIERQLAHLIPGPPPKTPRLDTQGGT